MIAQSLPLSVVVRQRRSRPHWEGALAIVLVLAGFAFVCVAFHHLFPLHIPGVSYKLESFARQKDKFDLVFVGTSRVYHGISPKIFNDTARDLGIPMHSFNGGMDGMNTDEAFAFTRQLTAFHPHHLRYLIFELAGGTGVGTPVGKQAVTERNVYWRDWQSLVSAVRVFRLGISLRSPNIDGPPYSERRFAFFWPLFAANVRLWAKNQTGLGQGFERIEQTITRIRHRAFSDAAPPPNWKGFSAMSRPMEGDTLATYRKSYDKVRSHSRPHRLDPIMKRELESFVHEMAGRRIKVFFLVPPSLESARGSEVNCPHGSVLFSYSDYRRYPRFYAEENRLDSEHLNSHGAETFSRTLAQDFVRANKTSLSQDKKRSGHLPPLEGDAMGQR